MFWSKMVSGNALPTSTSSEITKPGGRDEGHHLTPHPQTESGPPALPIHDCKVQSRRCGFRTGGSKSYFYGASSCFFKHPD